MDAFPQPRNPEPNNRLEPLILTDLYLDDEPDSRDISQSPRALSFTLLISLSAHLIILVLAIYAAQRDTHPEQPVATRPSIQIRFQQPPQITETSTEQPPATDPIPTPDEEIVPPEDTASAEAITPAETVNVQPDSTADESIADTPAPSPPRLQPPSLTDLRTAVLNRAEQDHQSRSTHPDCLTRERRRSDYLDCGNDHGYDFARAEHNDTVAFFAPTSPADPDNNTAERTSTGARVRAAIDMVDSQLGTTQTKKRLMNIP